MSTSQVSAIKAALPPPAPAARKHGAKRMGAAAQDYPALLAEVKARIQSAQYAALRAVNKELIGLYWDIGRMIVERQQAQGWGKGVVERLSNDLRAAFPGVRGFSAQNLWYMRQFFQEYSATPKLQPLVGEIGWSKNVLAHQIDNQSYEKSSSGASVRTNGARFLKHELCQ